ncbi:MAG TPA: cysteine desulfurase [Candidatus Omnitrophota bacterium]|nr:cysteine desulfurase [Candidatus Omnitrophota bacterium]HPD85373.1 cysteine desulfurase [Candidatus Omnitrophota bacterium]HRZ04126.1 cysteine desulfurase [Candidatus Omnitrophota bacterium]
MKTRPFDLNAIRKDFPTLSVSVRGKPLVYLDNAATTLKPKSVIRALNRYYKDECSNVHRGVHYLSEKATAEYERAREKISHFINARLSSEIIFTRGTTDAINIVAQSYGRTFLKAGDEILISHMEHHSNIVPWQILCEEKGCVLKVAPVNDAGELILDEFKKLVNPKTRFISIVYVSNSLGTINPIKEIIDFAHAHKIPVLVDAAQAVGHRAIDVRGLDCDFLAFSGHKLFGPTGVGVLYGKEDLLNAMPPAQGGGDMIATVTFEKTTYNVLPYKFEAGTPPIAGVIGLGAAVDYVRSIGFENIGTHEKELLEYGTRALKAIPGLRLIGTAQHKASILSFVLDKIHPHDLGTLVDEQGVAIRTGHHCTMPLMARFNVPATARASLAFYNTKKEIDSLVAAIYKAKKVFT